MEGATFGPKGEFVYFLERMAYPKQTLDSRARELVRVAIDTGEKEFISAYRVFSSDPKVSPDGNWIAFEHSKPTLDPKWELRERPVLDRRFCGLHSASRDGFMAAAFGEFGPPLTVNPFIVLNCKNQAAYLSGKSYRYETTFFFTSVWAAFFTLFWSNLLQSPADR